MTTLREAAQALLDAMFGSGLFESERTRLAVALALPDAPRGGWEEGAEAAQRGLMDHLGCYRLPEDASIEFAAGVRHHTAHIRRLPWPVPSAPTPAPEAKGDATMCAGCWYVTDEPACMLGFKLPLGTVCSVYRPAPEAPTKEGSR